MSDDSLYSVEQQAYYDNAGYDLSGGSIEMAERFILACRRLIGILRKRISRSSRSEELENEMSVFVEMEAKASRWLDNHRPASTFGAFRRISPGFRFRG